MIVDLIILVIIILAIILGRHKGLTVCLVNFFSLIIALIVALMVYKPISNHLYEKTPIGENIKQVIKQNIPMSEEDFQISEDSILPEGMKNYINTQAQSANETKDEAIENVSTELSKEVISIIAFVVVFIVVRLLLVVVKIVSKIITKLPILKQVDHLGGAIIGAIEGIIIVYFVFAIISVMSPIFNNTKVLEQIDNSHVGKMMYNNNIVMKKIMNKND